MELVSVIIPTYNRQKLIKRSIESVLNQTYKELEVIVIDDCSFDNTEKVVKNILDKRLKYIKLDRNSGACVARNVGINASKGSYIAFQDSDDVWHENKLEIQIELMKKKKAVVSFSNMNEYRIGKNCTRVIPVNCKEGFLDYNFLLQKSVVSTQCMVAKKECFSKIKFDSRLPRLQDWDIVLQLSKKYPVLHINIPLVNMYLQMDSISNSPEKGVQAIKILWEKNKEGLSINHSARKNWYVYLGNYKLACFENPANEYRKALKIKFDKSLFLKFLMAKFCIIIPIYKRKGII